MLVTTNYDLTVRRVKRSLAGLDCYLLVAPASGLDVWCAAGGGRFTSESILSVLKTSRIAKRVDHRRLLLPQLCANGINLFEVRRRTGWTAVFGPVDAADVPEFLRGRRKTTEMTRVRFPLRERLEMAAALWGSVGLRYVLFPLILLGPAAGLTFLVYLAVLALGVSVGCFRLPGKTFVQKAAFLWLPLALIHLSALWAGGALTPGRSLALIAVSLGAAFLVGSSFPSYSPLWQCGYSRIWFGYPDLELSIKEEDCIGCKLCDQVCPVDCFSPVKGGKVVVASPDLCEGCMACMVQCPTDAIVNKIAEEHQRLSACG